MSKSQVEESVDWSRLDPGYRKLLGYLSQFEDKMSNLYHLSVKLPEKVCFFAEDIGVFDSLMKSYNALCEYTAQGLSSFEDERRNNFEQDRESFIKMIEDAERVRLILCGRFFEEQKKDPENRSDWGKMAMKKGENGDKTLLILKQAGGFFRSSKMQFSEKSGVGVSDLFGAAHNVDGQGLDSDGEVGKSHENVEKSLRGSDVKDSISGPLDDKNTSISEKAVRKSKEGSTRVVALDGWNSEAELTMFSNETTPLDGSLNTSRVSSEKSSRSASPSSSRMDSRDNSYDESEAVMRELGKFLKGFKSDSRSAKEEARVASPREVSAEEDSQAPRTSTQSAPFALPLLKDGKKIDSGNSM